MNKLTILKHYIIPALFLLITLFLLLTPLFYSFKSNKKAANRPISLIEKGLGRTLTPFIRQDDLRIMDDDAEKELDKIVQLIYKQAPKNPYKVKAYFIKDKDVNAATLLLGQMVVFSGMVEFCETPEELTAVLAHEMGHVINRDPISSLSQQLGMSVFSYLMGAKESQIKELLKDVMVGHYSRKIESDADEFSFKILGKLGISPAIMGDLFTRLEKKKGHYSGVVEDILDNHPSFEKRRERAYTVAKEPQYKETKKSGVIKDIDFKKLKEAIKAKAEKIKE